MATKLHVLKAMEGDAFILTVEENGNMFNMVIDGGPLDAYHEISVKLNQLDHIDILVITHFDRDHYEGIIEWLKEDPSRLQKIGKIWVNCAGVIPVDLGNEVSAYSNSHFFKEFLEGVEQNHPDWNIDWKQEIIAGYKYTNQNPFVEIEIIAPTNESKGIFEHEYEKQYPAISAQGVKDQMSRSLKELADDEILKPAYQKVNNSSIAMIIRTNDKSLLMTGDCMATDMYNYITQKLNKSKEDPLSIDIMKLSHHGSRYNINNDLLDIVDCDKYLITTNGGAGNANHPDRQTIAKILKRDGRRDKHIEICLNYSRKDEMASHGTKFLTDDEISDKNNNFDLIENIEWL